MAEVRVVPGKRSRGDYWCLRVDDPRGDWFVLPVRHVGKAFQVGMPFFVTILAELGGWSYRPSESREEGIRNLLIDYYAAGRGDVDVAD